MWINEVVSSFSSWANSVWWFSVKTTMLTLPTLKQTAGLLRVSPNPSRCQQDKAGCLHRMWAAVVERTLCEDVDLWEGEGAPQDLFDVSSMAEHTSWWLVSSPSWPTPAKFAWFCCIMGLCKCVVNFKPGKHVENHVLGRAWDWTTIPFHCLFYYCTDILVVVVYYLQVWGCNTSVWCGSSEDCVQVWVIREDFDTNTRSVFNVLLLLSLFCLPQ